MSRGAFVVAPYEHDPDDIHFAVNADAAADVPVEQLELRDSVDHALIVLRAIFPRGRDDKKFAMYYNHLLSLAQLGLVGDGARPDIAQRALESLKSLVVVQEGGRIKNAYMKRLGSRAILFSIAAIIGSIVASSLPDVDRFISTALIVWVGSMAGTWLSFGTRKTNIQFDDLHILEEDRLEPEMRLIFSGLFSIVLSIAISTDAIRIAIGAASSHLLMTDYKVALLIGALGGLSEKALPERLTNQALRSLGIVNS